jgi:rhamnose utilization protein RhaD (predicted bifunctional aldolase and dehydrogenase)/NAD(P)-dependent dehydrogenase (short-subunit alcohol dehydrogenase family)
MTRNLTFLKDLWTDKQAGQYAEDPLELLRYRSNLLGSDLRITNFGGGNTSSKIELPDPISGKDKPVLAIKGSGGDLGSITRAGFAILSMDRLEQLPNRYRGESTEDEMVSYYPFCAFGANRVAASIDTPLHGFLPFPHVDHLHADWAIALAASSNGRSRLQEFNKTFERKLLWIPWQRPGFELGLMLRKAVEQIPDADGIILASHGLFTWGSTQKECYTNSIFIIDELGQFIDKYARRKDVVRFGGATTSASENRTDAAAALLPVMRGLFGTTQRSIAHYHSTPEVLEFAGSAWAADLAELGTSCPDHFLRTRIKPLFVSYDPKTDSLATLKQRLSAATEKYCSDYADYYRRQAESSSPAMRDPNPTVVIVPSVGLFSFGKNTKEARVTGEFFINAINVMAGATSLEGGGPDTPLPQSGTSSAAANFRCFHNYVSLPLREAFRIEYWALEEAKLRRMPEDAEFSRRIFLVVGGGSGIGRATVLEMLKRGAHVMVADRDTAAAAETAKLGSAASSAGAVSSCFLDLISRASIAAACDETVLRFGGIDGVVNTAAIFLVSDGDTTPADDLWSKTFAINVTGNYLLADEAKKVFALQGLSGTFVLTSSANAVVAKKGSEAYDVSKAAVNQLVRELALSFAPTVRVNGIAPATVIEGSMMFPRDRVMASLTKYAIPFEQSEQTDVLRQKLATFYAQRTITQLTITPEDCAQAICWLSGDKSAKTTGHIIPVDGGLPEAFLR